jgi:hypothetical protein
MGVLSAFAVLWSAMETWSWNRRSGMDFSISGRISLLSATFLMREVSLIVCKTLVDFEKVSTSSF